MESLLKYNRLEDSVGPDIIRARLSLQTFDEGKFVVS